MGLWLSRLSLAHIGAPALPFRADYARSGRRCTLPLLVGDRGAASAELLDGIASGLVLRQNGHGVSISEQ